MQILTWFLPYSLSTWQVDFDTNLILTTAVIHLDFKNDQQQMLSRDFRIKAVMLPRFNSSSKFIAQGLSEQDTVSLCLK